MSLKAVSPGGGGDSALSTLWRAAASVVLWFLFASVICGLILLAIGCLARLWEWVF